MVLNFRCYLVGGYQEYSGGSSVTWRATHKYGGGVKQSEKLSRCMWREHSENNMVTILMFFFYL